MEELYDFEFGQYSFLISLDLFMHACVVDSKLVLFLCLVFADVGFYYGLRFFILFWVWFCSSNMIVLLACTGTNWIFWKSECWMVYLILGTRHYFESF